MHKITYVCESVIVNMDNFIKNVYYIRNIIYCWLATTAWKRSTVLNYYVLGGWARSFYPRFRSTQNHKLSNYIVSYWIWNLFTRYGSPIYKISLANNLNRPYLSVLFYSVSIGVIVSSNCIANKFTCLTMAWSWYLSQCAAVTQASKGVPTSISERTRAYFIYI